MKCIVIEDELPAIKLLENYINRTSFLDYLGAFESISQLPVGILNEVDFIFLDIQLPGINGLEFLKHIEKRPMVIITTAYREYALDAFEVAVEDYLLKPFSYERFLKSIYRLQNLQNKSKPYDNVTTEKDLFVYADKIFYKIIKQDINYIKSETDYVLIYYQDRSLLVQDSMNSWERKLEGREFLRIHRSYLVNLSKITKVEGNMVFVGNTELPIGKTYRSDFFFRIKKNY